MIPPLSPVYGGFAEKLLDLGCCQALLTGVEPQPGLVGVLGLDQAGAASLMAFPACLNRTTEPGICSPLPASAAS